MILYRSKNAQLFLISIFCYYNFYRLSDPVKWNPILDQFSMITRPYPRVNGLKTIPFPVAHTHIANIWEYPSPLAISKHSDAGVWLTCRSITCREQSLRSRCMVRQSNWSSPPQKARSWRTLLPSKSSTPMSSNNLSNTSMYKVC